MIIYCDMDMVLCNFLKGALDVTGEPFPDKTGKLSKDEKKAIISSKKDFWDTLEWMPDGKKLWAHITKGGADVRLLSAYAEWDSNCRRGKKVWVARNLKPKPNKIHLVKREQKKDYANDDALLIDDHDKNCKEFINAGGKAIRHINTMQTIKEFNSKYKGD